MSSPCCTSKPAPAIKELDELTQVYAALAEPTRLRILSLLSDEEICVCDTHASLDVPQPTASRHLAYLRKSGLVEARREGKWMNYRIVRPENSYAARVLWDTLEWLESEEAMRKEYEKLLVACCCSSDETPVTIARAPKPNILPKADASTELTPQQPQKQEMETFLL